MVDVRGMLSSSFRNCDRCDVAEQPDPEAECRQCIEDHLAIQNDPDPKARKTLISCLLSPTTEWLLEIRDMRDGGCKFDPGDLTPATWKALGAIEREISAKQTERLRDRRH